MVELLSYSFMQIALIGGVIIGFLSGLFSPYLVLRRLSLIGDGIAHLAFGGVALGFLLGFSPLGTALGIAIIGALGMRYMIRHQIYGEAAIAIILSLGVGLAVVIIGATKGFGVNLFSYLIGSILTLSWTEIMVLTGTALLITLFFVLYRRELFLLTFQPDIARMQSSRSQIADIGFTIAIAFVTIMSVQAVGILLVSALLVVPGLIALRLSGSFKQTVLISVAVGISANIMGIIGSYYADIPPSGFIVLLLVFVYLLTFIMKRGSS